MSLFEDRKQSVDANSLIDWWNRYGGFHYCTRSLAQLNSTSSVIFPEEEDKDDEKTEGTMSIFAAFATAS